MTRKHFEAFAAMFKDELSGAERMSRSDPTGALERMFAIKYVIWRTADLFAEENSRFDREKFYLASGLNSEGGF